MVCILDSRCAAADPGRVESTRTWRGSTPSGSQSSVAADNAAALASRARSAGSAAFLAIGSLHDRHLLSCACIVNILFAFRRRRLQRAWWVSWWHTLLRFKGFLSSHSRPLPCDFIVIFAVIQYQTAVGGLEGSACRRRYSTVAPVGRAAVVFLLGAITLLGNRREESDPDPRREGMVAIRDKGHCCVDHRHIHTRGIGCRVRIHVRDLRRGGCLQAFTMARRRRRLHLDLAIFFRAMIIIGRGFDRWIDLLRYPLVSSFRT